MNEISRSRFQILLLISSISLQIISAVSDDSSITKNGNLSAHHSSKSSPNTGAKVVIILVGVAAVGLFSFFLFKLWQKKKREEQYARLLKLFEEDDELEVELGLQD